MISSPFSSPPPLPATPRGPWGFWATLGWGVLVWEVNDVGSALCIYPFTQILLQLTSGMGGQALTVTQAVKQAGMFGQFVGLPLMLIVLWWVIRHRNGPGFAEYLGLRRFSPWQLVLCGSIAFGVLIVGFFLAAMSGDRSGAESNQQLAASGAPLLLMIVALGLVGPIKEEVLFRGFLYRGIAAGRSGWIVAILIPNLLWVLQHGQYDGAAATALFFVGCIYGLARHYSGTVILPIILHMLQNLLVTYVVHFGPAQNLQ